MLLKKLASVTLASVVIHTVALADGYQYDFDHAFSGTPPASLSTPWTQARFVDIAPGMVQLTVSNLNLSGHENVDQLYFNLAPALDPTKLNFTHVSDSGGFDLPTFTEGVDSFKADGDGKYDILLNFAVNDGTHTFTTGESFTYTISGIAGLRASDFGYLSAPAGGAGPFYAAAHVQRIGAGSLSGWISADIVSPILPVPEPGAGVLLGLAITIWFGFRLWKRSTTAASELKKRKLAPIRGCIEARP